MSADMAILMTGKYLSLNSWSCTTGQGMVSYIKISKYDDAVIKYSAC